MTQLLEPPAALLLDELDEELVCVAVVPVTHDVSTFVLETPAPLGFRAGQYVTLAVDVEGRWLERCYTISSPPTRPGQLSVTVKRVPGGPVSSYLHDHLEVGDRVRVAGPLGRFTLEEHPARRHLLLGAGSGITPLMSMTRTLRDLGGEHDVVLVQSVRTPADICFGSELEEQAAGSPGLRAVAVCETDGDGDRWPGEHGRLTLPMLLRLVPDLLDREVFVCGPAGYMAAVREMLAAAGVDPARHHEESFVLAGSGPAAGATGARPTAEPATTGFSVEFRRSGRTVVCEPGTTLLGAAAQAGLTLPSSCGEGVCGTCRSTLLEGRVDMRHGGGIRPREIARQQILVCCSTPLEDVVVDA